MLTAGFMNAQNFNAQFKAVKISKQNAPQANKGVVKTLHYDGDQSSAIGTGAAAQFGLYSYWPTDSLSAIGSTLINQVQVFISGVSDVSSAKIEIRTDQTSDPVYTQVFTPIEGLNNIDLSSPYPISGTQELYVGYFIETTGGYPAGCDAGPIAANGNGNWMLYDGAWAHLNELAATLLGNWNIRTVVSEPVQLDLSLQSLDMANLVSQGNYTFAGEVKNVGLDTITTFDLNYQLDNGTVQTQTISGLTLLPWTGYNYTHSTTWTATPGTYNLKIWVSNVNTSTDNYANNDTIVRTIMVASGSTTYMPLYEEFTSSTCAPCAGFNSSVFSESYLETNTNKCTVIKYQMSWPGAGDIYYTEEGGVRRNYYGVSGVPALYLNGESSTAGSTAALQTALDNEIAKESYIELTAKDTINSIDKTISIDVNILPYVSINNLTLHAVLVEKHTTQNVGSNGETSFYHVMMKMTPDASGTVVNLVQDQLQTVNLTGSIANTNIENWDDLRVIVFIQDNSTKHVWQSAKSVTQGNLVTLVAKEGDAPIINATIEITDLGTFTTNADGKVSLTSLPAQNLAYTATKVGYNSESGNIDVSSDTVVNIAMDKTEYTVTFKITSNDTVVNNASIEIPTIDTIETDVNGVATFTGVHYQNIIYKIKKAGYDDISKVASISSDSTFNVIMNASVGINNARKSSISIYPNPAKNNITVSGQDISKVEIYNLQGQLIKAVFINSNNSINTSDINSGTYYVKVISNRSETIKKLIIMK